MARAAAEFRQFLTRKVKITRSAVGIQFATPI